jgi:hypothetical protein
MLGVNSLKKTKPRVLRLEELRYIGKYNRIKIRKLITVYENTQIPASPGLSELE